MLVLRSCWGRPFISFSLSTARAKKEKTFYQLLEVSTTASATAIKKNYLKLAKIYHPDVYKGADKNRFQKIQEAYKILSNQTERSRYDQTLGLSVPPRETSEDPQTTKHKNDFSYTASPQAQINIDEEYEKFFKKKSTTHFEDIRLHQQNEFKAMSENQRIRRRFKEVYTDANLDYKMRFSKSYNQILDDQIKQKNTYEEEVKRKEEEFKKKYNQQGILYRTRAIKIGSALFFLAMLPFVLSIRTKMQLEKESRASYEQRVKEVFSEMENNQIRSRMRFD